MTDEAITDEELLDAFRRYHTSGDRRLRNSLIEAHSWLATTCARRFQDRGEPLEDLVQVALLGLVKAVERFDPDRGVPFAGFAMPTVTGELRRHFRDTTWALHVPRRMKELSALLAPTSERLREVLGRHPTPADLAEELDVSIDDILGAMEAAAVYRASSIHRNGSSENQYLREPGEDDPDLERAELRLALERLLTSLPERERTILELRYDQELTQSEIADVIGTSQVHVSRLLRSALATLRQRMDPDGDIPSDDVQGHVTVQPNDCTLKEDQIER
jgi:RNA polymerase sigma-B factor